MRHRFVVAGLVFATLALLAAPGQAGIIGCPAGQAIRGIDLMTHNLVCVSVGTADIAALRAALAALQAQVAALHTLTSPDGQYVVDVTNDGIRLQGPGVLIRLDTGDPLSPSPTVTIAGRDVDVIADATTNIRSGTSTDIQSGTETNVDSGSTTNIAGSGATNIQGSSITLNGACAPVARVGDLVALDQIVTGSVTVRSC